MGLSVLSILRLTVNIAAASDLSFPIKELINQFEAADATDELFALSASSAAQKT